MDLRPRSRTGPASWVCKLCNCVQTHTARDPRLGSVPCCPHLDSADTFFEQGAHIFILLLVPQISQLILALDYH